MHQVEADDVWCALRRLGLDLQWKTGRLIELVRWRVSVGS